MKTAVVILLVMLATLVGVAVAESTTIGNNSTTPADNDDGGLELQTQIYIVVGVIGVALLIILIIVLINSVNISQIAKQQKQPPSSENGGLTNFGFTEGVNNPRPMEGRDDLVERGYVQYSGREDSYKVNSPPHHGEERPSYRQNQDNLSRPTDDFRGSRHPPSDRSGDKDPQNRYSSGEGDIPLENMEGSRYGGRGLPRVLPAVSRNYDQKDGSRRPNRPADKPADRPSDSRSAPYNRPAYTKASASDKQYAMW